MKKIKNIFLRCVFGMFIVYPIVWFVTHHVFQLEIKAASWLNTIVSEHATIFLALFGYVVKEIFWNVSLSISRAYRWDFITINKVAHLVSKEFSLPEDDVLRGLLVATYKGEFKESLFADEPQPTEHEKKMTELARKVQANSLSQEQLDEAINTLKSEYAEFCNASGNSQVEKTEDLIRLLVSTPQWKGSGSKQIGSISIDTTFDKKMRPLATELVTEKSLIGKLSWCEQRFNDFFPEKDLPETFDELRKNFPVEFQHFLRTSTNDYKLSKEIRKRYPEFSDASWFIPEFKKMKISGKTFKVWLKRFLNGDFD
ncbi:MAG: hypothetical protein I8H80_01145 [Alphaproteobacteria bacterium]|nr:hypothetical protein [Alphaproteobacteria bacterium]